MYANFPFCSTVVLIDRSYDISYFSPIHVFTDANVWGQKSLALVSWAHKKYLHTEYRIENEKQTWTQIIAEYH
jgi:hypothetical protein